MTTPNEPRREGGFTLIELLVVVIVIGILAAIAIPTFLVQREKAWEIAARSELRSAALAQESVLRDASSYTTDLAVLAGWGYNASDDVVLAVVSVVNAAAEQEYCMTAQHDAGGRLFYIGSDTGAPSATVTCT